MHGEERSKDYVIEVHDDPASLDGPAWNALLDEHASANPFLRHEMLCALHDSGSAVPRTGWTPCFVTLRHGTRLEGACPAYLKTHSYGEYVFDWAWADAYERHGLAYYPKLLGAVPFTPVPGPRLVARSTAARTHLLTALRTIARQASLSSVHLLFIDEDDEAAARDAGWMIRQGVQFHWSNRSPAPYADFEDFLSDLKHDKRKKIRQERRKVDEAGVRFTIHEGGQIDKPLWDFFHRCYTLTYRAHHSTPYLTRDFFARMASTMAQHWVMFVAEIHGRRIGASLVALDPQRRIAYGRYWGSIDNVPCLHFEACYYQPLSWCIANGYRRFEGGAQGEHKMARGLMPVRTSSAHWLAHPQFAHAVADFLQREGAGVENYVDELRERNPFRDRGESAIAQR